MLFAAPSTAAPRPTGESYATKVMLAREAVYLPVDHASLARATAASSKGMTHKYGLWVTSAEAKAIDSRFAFEENVHKSLLPFAEKQPGYAGAWFDRGNGGQLVVQTKKTNRSLLPQLVSRLPVGPAGVRVQVVKLTETELQSRVNAISKAWKQTVDASFGPFIAIAARTPTSRVIVTVDGATLAAATKALPTLRKMAAPAAVTLQTGSWANNQSASCTDRDHCTSPMKAGDVITRSGGVYCTMGIMVKTSGGDDQFTTSGHCGSGTWSHAGYGTLGSQVSTLYNSTRGVDLQLVQMPNTQAGNTIYGAAGYFMTASRYPVYGEGTIISLGHSNKVYADPNVAYVTDDYMTYTSPECSCTIHGGDTSITTVGGDSGSPVTHSNVALGNINTTGGYFARIQEALNIYGMTIVNS